MKLSVSTSNGPYDIHFVHDGFDSLPEKIAQVTKQRLVVLASNPTVYKLYGGDLEKTLKNSGFTVVLLELPDGEEHKNIISYTSLVGQLDGFPIDRQTPLIALGGGITGDLAGFVASTILRGIPLIQVPTTLLSMVDSSVGGKVGINTSNGKNRIGSFYHPSLVFIATHVLKTLPKQELRCGLGEVLKHGLLGDEAIIKLCEDFTSEILDCDLQIMNELIIRNCRVKSSIVQQDEKEQNVRALLNFGHTVGHAIEASLGYGHLKHGECIGIGLLAEMAVSVDRGYLSSDVIDRIKNLMKRMEMPVQSPNTSVSHLVHHANYDKKRVGDKISFTMLHDIEKPFLSTVSTSELPVLFTRLMEL